MVGEGASGGLTSVRVRVKANEVEITIAPEDFEEMRDEVAQRYGAVRLSVRPKGLDSATCTQFDCFSSPWKGGINIDRNGNDGPCSTAFVVYRLTLVGGNTVPTYRLLTAGHCGYDGTPGSGVGKTWHHDDNVDPYNDHTIGEVQSSKFLDGTPCDCQLLDIASGWDGHKYRKNNNDVSNILGVRTRSSMEVGDDICQSGARAANRRCGEITDLWYATSYDQYPNVELINQMLADYSVIAGDSGGPVMARYTENAVGVQSGLTDGGEAIFTHLQAFVNEYTPFEVCTTGDSWSGC
jgi:V8-like Glu-specific endopeptidase